MNQMLPKPRFWADAAAQCKTRFSLFGEMLILLLLYLISTIAQSLILAVPLSAWMLGEQGQDLMTSFFSGASPQSMVIAMMERMPDWMALVSLFATFTMGLAAVIYCKRFQKRDLASMGLGKAGVLRESLLGLAAGLLCFLTVLALGVGVKGFRLVPVDPSGRMLLLVLLALLGCAVQGSSVELLLHGYFAPSVGARYPVIFALVMSALLPAVFQADSTLFSISGLNSFLLALLLGIWVLKRGNLWGACAFRGAWFFASSFLFDAAEAGAHTGIRLADLDADPYRPLLTGGIYGPQASICATVVLLAALGVVLALKPRDPAPVQGPEQNERPANFL